MIEVTDLRKTYAQPGREIRALDGVTLRVPAGSVHGVIGQSGAGKSTLVRCLALLDRPTAGSVVINGVELTGVRAAELRRARRRLGVVFQQANLFDSRTVAENVAYPLELAGVPGPRRRARVRELLGLVGLADAAAAFPAQLSGGQRQRVGIARALATDPDVLLCDEPTSALDPATTAEILELIADLRVRLGLAVLVITHEMAVVKRACDSVSLLQAGRIVQSGDLVAVVGAFGTALSESLLGLPPGRGVPAGSGTAIEVLSRSERSERADPLSRVEAHLGVRLPVLAGITEELGGVTFARTRVLVPDPVAAADVLAQLRASGASARPSESGVELVGSAA